MAEEEQRKGPYPANDNGSHSGEPSIPAFGGLPKQLADSLLARRVSLRPPPMTMNHGDDSHVESCFPKTGLGFSEPATFSSCSHRLRSSSRDSIKRNRVRRALHQLAP
jgi:hypothetical protein